MFSDLRSILHDLYKEQKSLLASAATLGAYRTIRNITHICLDSALWAAHVGGLTKMEYYFRYPRFYQLRALTQEADPAMSNVVNHKQIFRRSGEVMSGADVGL
jgi:hypothetical protein